MSVESNPGLHWFCVATLCDWSRKLAPPSRPIRCKTKTNRDLVTRVFPRLRLVTRVYFELSLAPCDMTFVLIGRCDYFGFGFSTLNWKLLYIICLCFPRQMLTYGRRIPLPELDKRIEVRRLIHDWIQSAVTLRSFDLSFFIGRVLLGLFWNRNTQNRRYFCSFGRGAVLLSKWTFILLR